MPRKGANRAEESINNWAELAPPDPILDRDGACAQLRSRDPEVAEGFFLESKNSRDPRLLKAKALCAVCPVRQKCLDYAMSIPEAMDYGVWGGTTRNQRLVMRGKKRIRKVV